MAQEELSTEDKSRVENCDNYKLVKSIMKSHEIYKNIGIGEVYYIKYKTYAGYTYVSRQRNDKKDKFMVFHKDENDFVFLKRINGNGKLGKEVICLTTQYPAPKYEIEADPEYVESIIFETEDSYDPLAAEKDIAKKKGKARRRNKKIEWTFEDIHEAYKAIGELKVGDVIYDASTSYGSDTVSWTVKSVIKRPVDTTQTKLYPWSVHTVKGKTEEDRLHINASLKELIVVKIEANGDMPHNRRWNSKTRKLTYDNLCGRTTTYYKQKPYTIEDF